MSKSKQAAPVDLAQMAHRAMVDYGFQPDFPQDCLQQVRGLVDGSALAPPAVPPRT